MYCIVSINVPSLNNQCLYCTLNYHHPRKPSRFFTSKLPSRMRSLHRGHRLVPIFRPLRLPIIIFKGTHCHNAALSIWVFAAFFALPPHSHSCFFSFQFLFILNTEMVYFTRHSSTQPSTTTTSVAVLPLEDSKDAGSLQAQHYNSEDKEAMKARVRVARKQIQPKPLENILMITNMKRKFSAVTLPRPGSRSGWIYAKG